MADPLSINQMLISPNKFHSAIIAKSYLVCSAQLFAYTSTGRGVMYHFIRDFAMLAEGEAACVSRIVNYQLTLKNCVKQCKFK